MSMKRPMPFYVEDWIADTQDLDACRQGAYLGAVLFAWRHGSLPADIADIIGIMKLRGEHAPSIAQALLKRFFSQRADGSWVNGKCERVRQSVAAKSLKAHEKAQKAAIARWSKPGARKHAPSMLQALPQGMPIPVLKSPTTLSPSQAQGTPPATAELELVVSDAPASSARHRAPLRAAAKRHSGRAAQPQTALPLGKPAPAPRLVESRAKNSPRHTPKNSVNPPQDARFDAVANEIRSAFWVAMNPGGGDCPWANPEKAANARLLRENPNLTIEQVRGMLHHRSTAIGWGFASAAQMPRDWLVRLPTFAAGPVNDFGAPVHGPKNAPPVRRKPTAPQVGSQEYYATSCAN